MTEADFQKQAAAIAQANNIPTDTAAEYLALIGDTPELADDGKTVVRGEDGIEIARVTLPE